MPSATVPALVIRRTYDAAPERVFEAWTDPHLASQFLCPAEMGMGEVTMDVRAGGAFRIKMIASDGEAFVAVGTYREVREPSRLSMTWTWEEDEPSKMHETLLTLDFAPHGTGTELTLTHERIASAESLERHRNGWNQILDKLATQR